MNNPHSLHSYTKETMATSDDLLDLSYEVHVTVLPGEWEGATDDEIAAEIAGRIDKGVRSDLRNSVTEFGGVEITFQERR